MVMLKQIRPGYMGLSDRRMGDLHYACRYISDEAFEYVLRVARSFAIDDRSPGDRLKRQDRFLLDSGGRATLLMGWEFDGELQMSDVYIRSETGNWRSTRSGEIPLRWAGEIESRYRAKLAEISVAAAREQGDVGN